MKDFDVIIIGSGIGGLISAGILTSRGLRTLLIEKQQTPGGYLASFKRNGFTFDAALDCISGVTSGGLIFKVLKLLNSEKDVNFVQVNPIRVSIFPDFEITVDRDVKRYTERLMMLFPSESRAIKNLFEFFTNVYNETQSLVNIAESSKFEISKMIPLILKLRKISYLEMLNEYVTDYKLKSILSDRCPFIGLPPSKVSALSMINMIMSYFNLGAYRSLGGFQKLADTFINGIKRKGGKVIFGNGARKILLNENNNICCGIQCDNGNEYTSAFVISNVDFVYTFNNLLAERYNVIAENMIKNIGASTSFFMVYAGAKGNIENNSSIGLFPSYNMEDICIPDRTFKEDYMIGITIPSIEDKARAPYGCHTVVLHKMMDMFDGKLDKVKCAEMIIKKAEYVMAGLKDKITILDSASPQTLRKYSGNFNGSSFGWRQIPGFKGVKGYGINNFYIAGHWGDMGGGVLAAAYSGAKAAAAILTKEGITVDF